MSVVEALKGAQIEVAAIHSPAGKLARIFRITRTFAAEILGQFTIIPYGIHAFRTHYSLPMHTRLQRTQSVSMRRNVPYGNAARTTMDIYIPAADKRGHGKGEPSAAATSSNQAASASGAELSNAPQAPHGAPVALFCHGGVWATGEAWQYSPLAHCLAKAGILTCVIQYSLYPQALVPQMVREVNQALTWTFDNISKHGGDPKRVSFVGHSAGAQLCTMALLHRAKAYSQQQQKAESHQKQGEPVIIDAQSDRSARNEDLRMPARLIGIAGVYNIAMHYQYEFGRGVAELSTMKRAMGGSHKFASQSPALILSAAAGGDPQQGPQQTLADDPKAASQQVSDAASGNKQAAAAESRGLGRGFAGLGRAIQNRFPGFMLGPGASKAKQGVVQSQASAADGQAADSGQPAAELGQQDDFMQLSVEDVHRLPPITLYSSTADLTVPWQQSEEMYKALQACDTPASHVVYKTISHVGFATEWPQREPKASASTESYQQNLFSKIKDSEP